MREVRLNGVSCPISPRAFDLLLCLIERRGRVVTQEELRVQVWGGAVLSRSVIARTIMKVRHAIGDRASEPTLIRSVNRVGYRFMAPVFVQHGSTDTSRGQHGDAGPPYLHLAPSKLRVAVLPFQNRTGDPQLGWVTLGLLSLVNQALETNVRLHVSSVATVLRALEGETSGIDDEPAARARTMSQLIGAQCVCGVIVSKELGTFVLDYWLFDLQGWRRTGRLEGPEPTALCQELGQRIERALLTDDIKGVRLQSDDPLANQAFARAMQAREARESDLALKLMRVVLELEPAKMIVRVQHFKLLVICTDGEAESVGRRLLRETLEAGDHRLAAELHVWMYHAIVDRSGWNEIAAHHMSESLRLTGLGRTEDWALIVFNGAAMAAWQRGNHEMARSLLERVVFSGSETGNQLLALHAKGLLGALEAMQGHLLRARELWEEGVRCYQTLNHREQAIADLTNLMEVCAALGLHEVALQHGEAALEEVPTYRRKRPNSIVTIACTGVLCVEFAAARRPEMVEKALLVCEASKSDFVGLSRGHFLLAVAQQHVCKREFDEARRLLEGALEIALEMQDAYSAEHWAPLVLHNEMSSGRYADAALRAEELLKLPLLASSKNLAGMRLHAQALDSHHTGDAVSARNIFGEAIGLLRTGRWSVHARLDAAWLDIERDDLDAARRVLEGTFSWLRSHPIGHLVDARLQFALGEPQKAMASLSSSLSFVQPDNEFARVLAECCARAVFEPSTVVSAAPRLPSVM